MILKCQCCGIESDFADGEAAFRAGWDAPPHFTGYVCCDLCPAVCIVLGAGHAKAHADWAANGRPETFNARCVTDEEWGTSQEAFERQHAEIKQALDKALGKPTH